MLFLGLSVGAPSHGISNLSRFTWSLESVGSTAEDDGAPGVYEVTK